MPTNRLADETSPYLLQHAHNPVDWYPWGDEALDKARSEDKPIFLSVGYSACHWCHVMERESFEDEAIAEYLNDKFVSVKVDREERPDIDNIYMEAVQVMTGQGGWPMTVFIEPQTLEPFFAGTYFPPEDRYGRVGFKKLLEQLHEVWANDRDKVADVGSQVREQLERMAQTGDDELSWEPIKAAFDHLESSFDPTHAGFGPPPKFPPSSALRLLLHVAASERTDAAERERAISMVERTLVRMAQGGMYDHIGGGFHRYSVDREWLVPHFEKMLYDNGLLLETYTEAYQATGRSFYGRIVQEVVEYLMREMRLDHPSGKPFYSATDADSEGEEGRFFVWTPDEVAAVLGAERGREFCEFYDIQKGGNFEGRSIPNRLHALGSSTAESFGHDLIPDAIQTMRDELYRARSERVAPATDTKILASWNGLVIGAMARAGAVFNKDAWRDAAGSAADFVFAEMVEGDRLHRTYKDERMRFSAYLDDYANMACACLDLFESRQELRWLDRAEWLIERMNRDFWDDAAGAYFYTADYHDNLLLRQKESYDGTTPASNSRAAEALLRLSTILGDTEMRGRVERILRAFSGQMKQAPRSLVEMLQSLDGHLEGPSELVLRTPPDTHSLAGHIWSKHLPNAVILDVPSDEAQAWEARIPVLRGKEIVDGKPTLYECFEGACQAPRHAW